ncbi:histidine kinase [Paenibacillus sp. V4I7]|uniref:sensor histidine kinase n=1 Tax=Paenibacillus sp. V4I7 TaxID=3042307 RepID=UPI002788B6A2|nr:histidine kinase [Paenibacillus sp. V4I7]MDQ0896751.1 two-component system sensor histidine kinase YesM [Paenibacillus sp. V4I7]
MFRHSIRNKLILFLLIATLVPFTTSIVVSYIFTKEKVTEDTITNNSALLSQAKMNLLNYLNGVVQASTTIYTGQYSSVGYLYDILQTEREIDYMSDKVIKSGLQVMSHSVKEIKQIYLYASVSDRSYLASSDIQGSMIGKYESLRQFPENKTVYFETTHESHNYNIALNVYSAPTPVLSMHRKIMYSPSNISIGELIIDLQLNLVSEISQSLFTHDQEELYILDDKGFIVFGPDVSKWGQPLEASWGNEAIYSDLQKGSYEWKNGAYAGINIYEKMKTDYVNWTIVKRLPYEQLTKSARQLTLINSLILTLFMLIVIAGTIYISIKFTEPIKQLIRYITRIQAGQVQLGQLNADIELTRTDEMGILANRFHGLMQDLNQMVMREYRLELANKSNQLMALQAQINPHFLNNALQSIGTLALQHEAPKIYALISYLAKMMHYSMNTNESVVPLRKEIEHIKAYLELQKQRFEHQFEIIYDIEESTKAISVPKMILQPLVENYFKHGFKPSETTGLLRIQATMPTDREDEYLKLIIEDNGIGITEERLREVKTLLITPSITDAAYIGLSNVLTRVQLYFTDDATLDIEHVQPQGLRIVIHIPMKREQTE